MKKIRKGDEIIVIAGKDKGKRGLVAQVLASGHLVVDGVNAVKKHQKPNPAKGLEGGIVEKLMPIDGSNVAIFNPATSKADRVGFKCLEDGKKIRVFKSNGEALGGKG